MVVFYEFHWRGAGDCSGKIIDIFCMSPWKRRAVQILDKKRLGKAFRLLAFLWVYVFIFWSIPKWQYAKTYCLLQDMGT
jgi:hypothetical protein